MSLSRLIIHSLINDTEYSRKVIPHLKAEYFTDSAEKLVFKKIEEYSLEYLVPPTIDAIIIEIANDKNVSEETDRSVDKLLEAINKPLEKKPSTKWLMDKTEGFCKKQAVFNALMESIKIHESESSGDSSSVAQILTHFKSAAAVSFDTSIGHDYFDDAEARWDYYSRAEHKIPYKLEYLNKITKGGVARKTLNLILGGVHTGKTSHMCSLAADNLTMGKNVLYVSNEMAEEEIGLRIDAKMMDQFIGTIKEIEKPNFNKKIDYLKRKTSGRLKIKQFPPSSMHAGILRNLLDELKLKEDFTPDIIYIDYLNICASEKIKMHVNVNSYTYLKVIAEEIRGLAIERDVAIISACQFTRSASVSSDPGMDDIADCIEVNQEVTLRDGTVKRIGDLQFGEQIISNDGYKTVKQVHHSKIKPCYKVTLKSGKSIIVSEKHMFPTIRGRLSISDGLFIGDKLNTI